MRWWKTGRIVLGGLLLTHGCADDPFDLGGPRSCETPEENAWVYEAMHQVYLWQDDLPEVDPLAYDSPHALVRSVRFDLDRWSRVSDKQRTDALFQEGKYVGLGYGTRRDAEGRLVISIVHEGSPAGQAGLKRGDVIQAIGGFMVEQIEQENRWEEVYGESEPGVDVHLMLQGDTGMREVTVTKDWVDIVTVPTTRVLDLDGRPVGYLVFSSFVEPALVELNDAFAQFESAGVKDVIVDLRYNGGGLISVAKQLMNLLVGTRADGEIGYKYRYGPGLDENDRDQRLGAVGQSLPDVVTVTFITTGSTLSASELVMNAIAPYVDVRVVGDTSGGKPVGSKHWEFCDKVLAPITFRLLNADDEGDYFEGFVPDCPAVDDFGHELGDPAESSLAEALHLLRSGSCSPAGEGAADLSPPARRQKLPEHPDGIELLRGVF